MWRNRRGRRREIFHEPPNLRAGPLASGFRAQSAPYSRDSRENLRSEFFTEIRNLREEFQQQRQTDVSEIINTIRESIQLDLQQHRRITREEQHNSRRISPTLTTPIPCDPSNSTVRTVHVEIHRSESPERRNSRDITPAVAAPIQCNPPNSTRRTVHAEIHRSQSPEQHNAHGIPPDQRNLSRISPEVTTLTLCDTPNATDQPAFAEVLHSQNREHHSAHRVQPEVNQVHHREISARLNPSDNPSNYLNVSHTRAHDFIPNLTPNSTNSQSNETVVTNRYNFIKPDTYDGTQSWSRYQPHFEIAAAHNGWTPTIMAAQLLTGLRGKAQLILEKIPINDRGDYNKIIGLLQERFDEKHLSRMYFNELQTRKQTKDEDYQSFAEDIERLVRLSHLNISEESRDEIACRSFINGINNTEIEFMLRSECIESLQKAVSRSTQLKSIMHLLNNKRPSGNSFTKRSQDHFNQSSHHSTNREFLNNRLTVSCFKCGKFGHYANKCDTYNTLDNNQQRTQQNSSTNNSSNRFHPYQNFNNGNRQNSNFPRNRSFNNDNRNVNQHKSTSTVNSNSEN